MTGIEIAIIWWLIDKATGGIFSEYIKKFWFSKVHNQKEKAELLHKELQSVVQSYSILEESARELIKQNAELRKEITRIKAENALLNARVIASATVIQPPPVLELSPPGPPSSCSITNL